MTRLLVGKFVGLALVAVLLLFCLSQITALGHERQQQRANAASSIAQSLAGSQTLVGPLLQLACAEEWIAGDDKTRTVQRREFTQVLAPAALTLNGTTPVEARSRGLYATQVFTLKSRITADWPDLKALEPARQHTDSKLQCGSALVQLAVTDARGIRQADMKVNGVAQTVLAGTENTAYSHGVRVALPATTRFDAPLKIDVELELVGTESLNIVPLGSATQINLSSNWRHPSFMGQFLPSERDVSAQGFESHWRVSALASSAQKAIVNQRPLCTPGSAILLDDGASPMNALEQPRAATDCVEILGVSFIDPINTYSLSDRATKYGLLFIVLTFVAVGLFEFMRNLRVHPIQYFLVGAAISIFFLLLVSLSEHMAFAGAYGIAATACVLLLAYYASHMLRSWKRGTPFAGGIAALYGLLYVLLQLEQTAMVVGAIALFVVLTIVMTLTRKVDWYARLQLV